MSSRLYAYIIIYFLLASCGKHYLKENQQFSHQGVKEFPANKQVNDVVNVYQSRLTEEIEKFLVGSKNELTKDGDETTIGNFACDALNYVAKEKFIGEKIDMVILNRGGLRAGLPRGEIKVRNIFELMPFDNEMVLLELKGEKLEQFFSLLKEKQHPFLGAKVKIKKDDISVLIDGQEIDRDKYYKVVTSDYLATGGDNFIFFIDAKRRQANIKIRDAMIEYCKRVNANGDKVKAYKDGRLEISK